MVCPLDPDTAAAALARRGQPPYSLLDVKQVALDYGLPLEGRECTLEEALSLTSPALLALGAPDHFVVALNQGGPSVQAVGGDGITVLSREALAGRFRGIALVPVPRAAPGPRLVVTEPHHETELAGLGDTVVHSFQIRNEGETPATVQLDSTPCCGVTAALDATDILPQATATLVVGVRVVQFGGLLRAVRVRTNDPSRRLLWFTMAVRTPPGVTAFPMRLELVCDNLPGGRDRSATIAVTGTSETDVREIEVDGVPATAESIRKLEKEDRRLWEVGVRPSPTAPPGEYVGNIAIHTVVSERPSTITIPLVLLVRANATPEPRMVFRGFVSKGSPPKPIAIRLRTRSGEPFRILGAKSTDPRIAVRTRTDGVITVSVSAATQGVVDGDVILTTDIPLEETIRIPVYAHILAR